jgi:predicted nucleic acid-binding protein
MKSLKTLTSTEKLAVDANPILSAIIGGNARTVFLSAKGTTFSTTTMNYREVEKYIPVLASKRRLPIADLYMALSMLPLNVCEPSFYSDSLNTAKRMIRGRDPDDIDLLALALKLACFIWSNDKDFEGFKVPCYTTLDLLRAV